MKVEVMGDSELKKIDNIDDRFIGQGERAALSILKTVFGEECEYKIQYLFAKLMKGDFLDTLSERQKKETLDIVVFRPVKPTIVFRIQDKHHDSILKTSQYVVQRQMLEWNGCQVVDLPHQECPTLWKDIVNEDSMEEVMFFLRKHDLIK